MTTALAMYVFSEHCDTLRKTDAADISATPDLIMTVLKAVRTRPVCFPAKDGNDEDDDANDIDVKDPVLKRTKTAHEDTDDASAVPCMEVISGPHADAQDAIPASTCVDIAKQCDATVIVISDSGDDSADESDDDPSEDSDDESAE